MKMLTPLRPADGGRDNAIGLVRLVLAIAVLWSHSYAFADGPLIGESEPAYRFARGQYNGGTLAVAGFFILSGYLLAASWARGGGAWDFLARRARRIYPGFVVVSALCVTVVPLLAGFDLAAVARANHGADAARALLLMPPAFPGIFVDTPVPGLLDGSTWTLRCEMGCYALLAALGGTGLLRRRGVVPALFVAAQSLAVLESLRLIHPARGVPPGVIALVGPIDYYPGFVAMFLAGVLFYLHGDRIARSPWLLGLALLVIAIAGPLGLLPLVLPACGGYALLYVALAPAGSVGRFAARADISYGIYLYAWTVQELLTRVLPAPYAPITFAAVSLAATFPLALASWYLVERPSLARHGRKRSHRATPGHAVRPAAPTTA